MADWRLQLTEDSLQVPVGDDHLPGGEGPGLAQEDLPKAPFEA